MPYEFEESVGDRVRIQKRYGVPNYNAYYRDNLGKKRYPSLRTTNLKTARSRAMSIARKLDEGIESPVATSKENARITFGQQAREYLAKGMTHKSARTKQSYREYLDVILTQWEDAPITKIHAGHIDDLLATLSLERKWAPSSSNRHLTAISQVLERAKKNKLIVRNPAKEATRHKEPEKVAEPISDEIFALILEVLPEYVLFYVCILVDTGMRRIDMQRIRWRDINTTDAQLTVGVHKNGEPKIIPMTKRLTQMLDGLRSGRTWTYRNWSWGEYKNLSNRIAYQIPADDDPNAIVFGRPDFKWQFKKAASKVGIEKLYPHQLRDTFATRLGRKGVAMEHVMKLGGWKTLAMADKYTKLLTEEMQPHVDLLEDSPGYKAGDKD